MEILRKAAKRALFGAAEFSRFRPIALRGPQSEVGVWLHGFGAPQDVTANNLVAAARPLTIGIGMTAPVDIAALCQGQCFLELRERVTGGRRLGEIGLLPYDCVPAGDRQLCLFRTCDCVNLCLPRPWLWSRYAYYAWKRRGAERAGRLPEIRMTLTEERCIFVFYTCPRPVVLLSVSDGGAVNMVPLDLMGPVGEAYFALALQSTSAAVPLIERSRRIALSSIPAEHTTLTYQLGKNHNATSIDLAQLPFALGTSRAFGLPVPQATLRIREFEIESVRIIGGYTMFLGRTVDDERRKEGPEFFLVHGFYKRLASGDAG